MSDIDVQIVRRFLSYIYLRDYDTPLPKLQTAAAGASARENRFVTENDSSQYNCLLSSVKTLFKAIEESCRTMTGRLILHVKRGNRYKFEPTLLAHADMYFFAVSYDLADLRKAVLARLAIVLTLIKDTLDIKNSGALTFVREVYKNSKVVDGEDIKNLASRFAARSYTKLMGEDLEGLVIEYEDFARDLLRKLNARIQGAERGGWFEDHW